MNIPEGWPTKEMMIAGHDEMWNSPSSISAQDAARIFTAMLAAAPTPPAPEVEPVGYRWRLKGRNDNSWRLHNDASDLEDKTLYERYEIELVYARPANDGLRKAAEEVFDLYDSGHTGNYIMSGAMRKLGAELDKGK